jgi:hypothetical protein
LALLAKGSGAMPLEVELHLAQTGLKDKTCQQFNARPEKAKM